MSNKILLKPFISSCIYVRVRQVSFSVLNSDAVCSTFPDCFREKYLDSRERFMYIW